MRTPEEIKQEFRDALASRRESMQGGAEADAIAEIGKRQPTTTRPYSSTSEAGEATR